MKSKYTCRCSNLSPFLWMHDPRPSIFQSDLSFRAAKTDGKSYSQKSTEQVEEARRKGETAGFLRGISRKKEEEMLRVRNFLIYSLAGTKGRK